MLSYNGYFSINLGIVWQAATQEVTALKPHIAQMLVDISSATPEGVD